MLSVLADHTAACSVKKQLHFDKIFVGEKKQRKQGNMVNLVWLQRGENW